MHRGAAARAIVLAVAGLVLCWPPPAAHAGPFVETGDLALRHDLQRLADAGVLRSAVSTWPLAWAPVLAELESMAPEGWSRDVVDSAERVRRRGVAATVAGEPRLHAAAGVADNPARIRSFQDTPRGKAELLAGAEWTGERLFADLNVRAVRLDNDGEDNGEVRFDDSALGVRLGNWSVAASTLERWWGPAWDGSLILSNGARPVPSLTVERLDTQPFDSRWLAWLGPWDFTVLFGRLEEERVVPNARFFGMRFNFRPLPSLEIGLGRTALWCGDGRPCGLDTFADLLLGRDNAGDEGVDSGNEPGDQLAGFDVRWVPGFAGRRLGVYGQFIGEDEAGGLPSRWLGQFGADWSGYLFDRWSSRGFVEFAATSCQFYESSERFNCAYNHGIYRTGYRFEGRPIGHAADNDARILSVGVVATDIRDVQWRLLARTGRLNRGGEPDPYNSLTPAPVDIASIDIGHSRRFAFGVVELGIGYEWLDDPGGGTGGSDAPGDSDNELRAYLEWHYGF